MIALLCLGHGFLYEMECAVRVFFPGEKIAVLICAPTQEENNGPFVRTSVEPRAGGKVETHVRIHLPSGKTGELREVLAVEPDSEDVERSLSTLLFSLLCEATGTRPPWGILTGVRPMRLASRWAAKGVPEAEIRRLYEQKYLVLPDKVELGMQTCRAQGAALAKNLPDTCSLYVSIPFCPTRCLYCSFVSHAVESAAKLIPHYVKRLCEELRAVAALVRRSRLRLLSVYIGGGTPTSLPAEQLEEILAEIGAGFDLTHLLEYTVEAGRPDTLSHDKLAVLRKYGVDRVSVNPQSMSDVVLEAIGRRHTAAQAAEGFAMARAAGFERINMDLIAGLPKETPESFANTLRQVLALGPENITLHTLTVKRSSTLRKQDDAFAPRTLDLHVLLESAREAFRLAGYRPYYLYRQKGTVQNHENTGYSLPGRECVYNIYSMEDVHTILGAGAGAGTKLCAGGEPRKRIFNHKYPYEYLSRFHEILERKVFAEEWILHHGDARKGID